MAAWAWMAASQVAHAQIMACSSSGRRGGPATTMAV
jgi:hypothetical protein